MWLLSQVAESGLTSSLTAAGPWAVAVILLACCRYLMAQLDKRTTELSAELAAERGRNRELTDRLFATIPLMAESSRVLAQATARLDHDGGQGS